MRIAILGAGFSGLATAWHLLHLAPFPIQIVIFDPLGIGKGASGVSAGLLHPYAGAHAKLNWLGLKGLESTQKLLKVSEKNLGRSPIESQGLLRLALTPEQRQDFEQCASRHPDVIPFSKAECSHFMPELIPCEGIWIQSALTINPSHYLQGLWLGCQEKGAHFEQSAVTCLEELRDFDTIVIAMGASSKQFPETAHLSITSVKGQVLELAWPKGLSPLRAPVNSQAYLVPTPGHETCLAGATFEHQYSTNDPEPFVAIANILPKISAFLPAITPEAVIGCRAGIRASTPDHRPFIKRINKRTWVLSGMGSKGLLYHSLFAETLSKEILSNSSPNFSTPEIIEKKSARK